MPVMSQHYPTGCRAKRRGRAVQVGVLPHGECWHSGEWDQSSRTMTDVRLDWPCLAHVWIR